MTKEKSGAKKADTKKKTSYHHGNLRTAVLDAAHKLMKVEGIQAITLRRLAKEVGVSQNAPYSHFKDKAALLDALAVEGFQGLIQNMRHVAGESKTASKHLQAIGKAYVDYALSNPELFQLMFNSQPSSKPSSDELQHISSESFQILNNAVERVQAEGETKEGVTNSDSTMIATVSAWAMVHGLCLLLLENKLSNNSAFQAIPREVLIEQATGIFTRGLRAEDN